MHPLFAWGAPEHTLTRRQWIPRSQSEVFAFFCDPYNLCKITPTWMLFHIVSMEPPTIGQGTLINYRLRWMGLPIRWRTLIDEWVPGQKFVDTALKSPYILWHHTHTFEPVSEGILMADHVRYRLPFGPFGVLAHRLLVQRQLNEIFDYRIQRIAELLCDGQVYLHPPK
jgi:hypothetical protein